MDVRRPTGAPVELTLDEVARAVGGQVVGDGSAVVKGVAGIREAGPGELTFLANSKYRRELRETRATAVLLTQVDVPEDRGELSFVVVAEPSLAFSRMVERFTPPPPRPPVGIHALAVIGPEVELGAGVSVGPHTVVEPGARIGSRTVLYPGVYVGHGVRIGDDAVLHANVVVLHGSILGNRVIVHPGAVIGSDGFGYVLVGNQAVKVPQQGIVEIEDDVEIGANTTIDRARFDRTRIGRGSKIDNLCQIAHNVAIGRSSFLAAQVGIAGSSQIGSGVMLGGQVGVSGHLKVADLARVAAQAGVSRDVEPGESVAGHPAMPARQFWRMIAQAKKLGELFAQVEALATRVEDLERNAEDDPPAA